MFQMKSLLPFAVPFCLHPSQFSIMLLFHPSLPSCHASALSAHHSDIHLFTHLYVIQDVLHSSCYYASFLHLIFYLCHILFSLHCAFLQFLISCFHVTILHCLLSPFCILFLPSFFLTLLCDFFLLFIFNFSPLRWR